MRRTTEIERPASERPVVADRGAVVDDQSGDPRRADRRDPFDTVLRALGVIVSSAVLLVGLIAVARIDWSVNGFSSPAVRVLNVTFSPWIAVGTAVAGLIGILAAASSLRGPKVVVGAVAACAGLAVMIVQPTVDHVVLGYRYGVMALVAGLVLVGTGLLMRSRRTYVVNAPATQQVIA
jgi:hypothetical protein